MDVEVQPLYDTATDAVSPHGLLGQTYDNDGVPKHGKRDTYERLDDGTPTRARKGVGGVITTHASGEGAIEGEAEDYRVRRPFSTQFNFTRFGKTKALPRNTTRLKAVLPEMTVTPEIPSLVVLDH